MKGKILVLILLILSATISITYAKTAGSLVGRWSGTSGTDGFTEVWDINYNNGVLTVEGKYYSGNTEKGGFHGKNVKYSNGNLYFEQDFYKFPDPSWRGGTTIEAWVEGDVLNFIWHNGGNSGTVKLKSTASSFDNTDSSSPFIATWIGQSGTANFTEAWDINYSNGAWSIEGKYYSGHVTKGGFHGKNIKYADGKLYFEQDFYKFPDPTWTNGTTIEARVDGNVLNFTWHNGGNSGTVKLYRE